MQYNSTHSGDWVPAGREGPVSTLTSLIKDIAGAYSWTRHDPAHVVEAILATAKTVGDRGRRKTDAVEEHMSSKAEKEIALTKLENVPEIFTSKIERYTNGRGQVRSKKPVFTTGQKPQRATALVSEVGLTIAGVGEAISEAEKPGDLKRELERAQEQAGADPEAERKSGKDRRDGGGEGSARSGEGEGEDDGRTIGFGNGTDPGQASPASERSDRKSKLDICFVNPPVEERCNRKQWEALVSRTLTIQQQWVALDLLDEVRSYRYSSGEEEEDDEWDVKGNKELHNEYHVPYPTETVYENCSIIEAKDGGSFISPDVAEAKGIEPKARELRISEDFLRLWTRLGEEGGMRRYKAHRRELVRTTEPQPMTTDLYDENRNDIPQLVEDALEVLQEANHEIILNAIEEAEEAIAGEDGAQAQHRLTSLRLAKETVERQIIQSQGGVVQLQNAYKIQSISGRVSFKRGGPQGLMKEVKARAYDIGGYRNFDIKSCHTAALKQVASVLEELGVEIDVSPWTQYVGKDKVVERTGLPRSLVKVVEHAVKYGAVLPASMKEVKNFYVEDDKDEDDPANWPSITREVHEHAQKGLLEDRDEALQTLHDVFGEMRRVVIKMAEALLTDYYEANHSGGWMKNACGVSFAKHTYDEGHEQRSKVMGWMLQGLEAAFCHHLTILSADSEAFSVVANEHDGLIIRKDTESEEAFEEAIESAIQTARERSGFSRADLVEKAHADDDDIEALYGAQAAEQVRDEEEKGEDKDTTQASQSGADGTEDIVEEWLKKKRSRVPAAAERQHLPQPDLSQKEMMQMRDGY